MPSVLGKRKAPPAEKDEPLASDELHDIFSRHFAAQFAPLDLLPTPAAQAASNQDDEDGNSDQDGNDAAEDGSEWDGLSDDGDPGIEVVDHSSAKSPNAPSMSKHDLKAFMSSRPPTAPTDQSTKPTAKSPPDDPEAEDSATLLANDLALQRLLAESHLLSRSGLNPYSSSTSSTSSTAQPFAHGRTRLKTQDLRVRALAKTTNALLPAASASAAAPSLFVQKKIPMALRKTQTANAAAREAKRRREARENGVVLERRGGGGESSNKKPRRSASARDGPDVALPSIGRMRGAELRISKRDILEMEGGGSSGGGRGGRRDGSKRGGGNKPRRKGKR